MADATEARTVTIHSSWRGIVGGFAGSGLIAVGGTYGLVAAGLRAFPLVLAAAGWALVAVMALDFPVASTFSSSGVRRRMTLRSHWITWREGDVLSRTSPKMMWSERRLEHGGLALIRGRKRYLLVDRPESGDEYDALVDAVERPGTPGASLGASRLPRPASSLPPSWLYRRRRWRPDSARGR